MEEFLFFVLVGFIAQLSDGALGMGFGVISSSMLLAQGTPPALVSATVNAAKIPNGSVAAFSHHLNGNIDWRLARKLAIFGAIGGVVGALLLSNLKGRFLHLMIGIYLVLIGALIIRRALRGITPRKLKGRALNLVGGAGGLIEGIGGSWGPIVAPALLGGGVLPRKAIGSSAFGEFIVSIAVVCVLTATFFGGLWGDKSDIAGAVAPIAGLIVGGIPAAFIGGYLARRVPKKPLSVAIGILAFSIGVQRLVIAF
ncbi:sulfite exporter TauE/SafE family protein [Actibacterium lipolyticum]|uniref:Probable membrane transporter protein n=1 Tax=Actibacterium lipolyticum TaxID=1524263 RepID=A0A238JKV3_9RHOB|nr:sulfite exporter TauE/SafE family protein [Actibacterium lipolyticum]SMX31290.1 Sulfite exporter TauE/SafE [Actibacterium lipolyticum]